MRKRKSRENILIGYVSFFLLVAAILTVAVLVYSAVADRFAGRKHVIAILMLAVVFVLTAVATLIDALRRKYMVDIPVGKILDATEKIAAGDFSVRLEIPRRYDRFNEYDYIMDNINKMAEELSKDKVLKSDFLSNVSHELKTPLSVIRNYAVALTDTALSPETRALYVRTLIDASAKLTDLVGNVLKLNRLENHGIGEQSEPVRLDELLAQSILGYETKIEEKNISLDCDLEEITVLSYPRYLEIVFNNLLSNAVKFTDCGGNVRVRLQNRDGQAVVQVSDTGCGISAQVGARIFDKFYQGDTSHSQEGNGLGLALVKKVIDTIGGTVSVESEEGKGSTFTVTLGDAVA